VQPTVSELILAASRRIDGVVQRSDG
jgi:hypothetical protein